MLDDKNVINSDIQNADDTDSVNEENTLQTDLPEEQNNKKNTWISTALFLLFCVIAFAAGVWGMSFFMNSSNNKEKNNNTTSEQIATSTTTEEKTEKEVTTPEETVSKKDSEGQETTTKKRIYAHADGATTGGYEEETASQGEVQENVSENAPTYRDNMETVTITYEIQSIIVHND